jgi:hypothetical protein
VPMSSRSLTAGVLAGRRADLLRLTVPIIIRFANIVGGSEAEVDRLREVEALASAVGGRRARRRSAPTRQFLTRLERAVRDFL